MLKDIKLNNIFLIDIETVPQYENFDNLPTHFKALWEQKSRHQRTPEQSAAEFYERAGIWAEFGKIVCISIGFFHLEDHQIHLRVRSFAAHDEKFLLLQFIELLAHQSQTCNYVRTMEKSLTFPICVDEC